MNPTIIAQMRKDAVPVKNSLIGMAGLFAVSFLFYLTTFSTVRNLLGWHGEPTMEGGLGLMLQIILLSSLIVRVIHQDPLTDPDVFWRTRPVSGKQLLLSKACFLLPLLFILLLLMFGNDPDASLLEVCVLFLGLATLAAVTNSFAGLLGFFCLVYFGSAFLCLGLLASFQFAQLFWNWTTGDLYLRGNASTHFSVGTGGQHPVTVECLFIVSLVSLAIFQYTTSNTRLTKRLIFLTCLIAIAFSTNWHGTTHLGP